MMYVLRCQSGSGSKGTQEKGKSEACDGIAAIRVAILYILHQHFLISCEFDLGGMSKLFLEKLTSL